MKKILLLTIICINILYASNSKYQDEKEFVNNDFRIFLGTEMSYSYMLSSESLDRTLYSYGLYLGLPIINNYDLIFKIKRAKLSQYDANEQIISLNIPLISRLTEQTYIGFKVSNSNITWNDSSKNKYQIIDKKDNGKYIGIALGKKYKFTRHYYVRVEIDYIKYDYKFKSTLEDITNNHSIGFNYGFEYRF